MFCLKNEAHVNESRQQVSNSRWWIGGVPGAEEKQSRIVVGEQGHGVLCTNDVANEHSDVINL